MVADEHLAWQLLPLAIFHTVVTMTGIVGNLVLCFITLKTKNLHTSCHILIGLTCFCDALHGSAHIPFTYSLYTNTKWISQKNCFYVLLLPLFGVLSGLFLLLSVGIDRLIAITFPNWYRLYHNKNLYLLAQLTLPFVYYVVFVAFAWFSRHDGPVMCLMPDIFIPSVVDWALSAIILNILTFIVYLFVYYKLKQSALSHSAKSVFKSVFVTVLFVVGGWFTTMNIARVAEAWGATGNALYLIQIYAGVPVNVACACNIFVYYSISSEYRNAIRRQFLGSTSQMTPATQTMLDSNRRLSRRSDIFTTNEQQIFTTNLTKIEGS